MSYENEDIVSLPAFTICTTKTHWIRKESFHQIFLNGSQKLSKTKILTKINNYLKSLPISEQFNTLYTFKESFLINCRVHRPIAMDSSKITSLDCNELTKVINSIDNTYNCMTFFTQLNGESDDEYIIKFVINRKNISIFRVKISVKVSEDIIIFLHSRTQTIKHTFKFNSLRIKVNESTISIIRFTKSIIKLLPKPYQTSCVDYRVFGYESRDDCITKCEINAFINIYNKYPTKYLSYNINNTLNFDLKQLKFGRNILEKCENFCGYNKDCYKEYFHYIEEREATYATNHMDIHVIPTTLLNTIITPVYKSFYVLSQIFLVYGLDSQ